MDVLGAPDADAARSNREELALHAQRCHWESHPMWDCYVDRDCAAKKSNYDLTAAGLEELLREPIAKNENEADYEPHEDVYIEAAIKKIRDHAYIRAHRVWQALEYAERRGLAAKYQVDDPEHHVIMLAAPLIVDRTGLEIDASGLLPRELVLDGSLIEKIDTPRWPDYEANLTLANAIATDFYDITNNFECKRGDRESPPHPHITGTLGLTETVGNGLWRQFTWTIVKLLPNLAEHYALTQDFWRSSVTGR